MKSFLLALGFALTSLSLAQAPVDVVATVGMVGDVAQSVGGECVNVTTLMGPGVDPHLYKASAGDVRTLQGADVILFVGYTLEGQLGEVLERFGRSKPTVAVAEAAVPEGELEQTSAYGVDPHIWMDVSMWRNITDVIAEELGALRPDCAEAMQTRAEAYKNELAALDAWVQENVNTIPEGQRALVTAHDAFTYYGRAYGLEVIAIQGISTESEAAIVDIRNVVSAIIERGVPAIFVESSVNPRTIEAVRSAVNDRGQEVSIGGQLFSDAFGEAGTWEGTYIGMLYKNTRTITEALGGTPRPLPAELSAWAKRWDLDAQAETSTP